jgi:hypothetical protein
MLIAKCCSKKIIRKNADSAIATFRATDDFKRPELLMFVINEVYGHKFNSSSTFNGRFVLFRLSLNYLFSTALSRFSTALNHSATPKRALMATFV